MSNVVFGSVALSKPVGMHGGAPGLVLGTVALALIPIRGRKVWIGLAAASGLAVSLLVLFIALFPQPVLRAVWQEGEARGGAAASVLSLLIGNDEIVAEIEQRRRPDELVVSEAYPIVHHLAFLSDGGLTTALANVRGGIHGLASLYWHRPEHFKGIDALFVSDQDDAADLIAPLFAACTKEEPVRVLVDEREVRRIRVMRCHDLRQPAPAFGRLRSGP